MKPYTKSTHGRNHYALKPKEHKVPKKSADRAGTRGAMRKAMQVRTEQELLDALSWDLQEGK